MLKMATYSGMNIRGEVRDSISLDDDDLSDVEDEVFIRDGKNDYKLAEEMNVKRPLMAPRRKIGKPDIATRLKQKPPCRVFCRPCCYVLAALTILIGLILLTAFFVLVFPVPLDRLRDWVISKSKANEQSLKIQPCSTLRVSDVWSVNLPRLTTDSPIRTLDVNSDGVEDILFGFSTGENSNVLPSEIFCQVIMGISPPCEGGILALNGINGAVIWRNWLNDTIFSLHCTADIDGDHVNDCLAVGNDGTITVVSAKNGTKIWQLNTGKMNIFVANFITDLNNDNISDIITSHSSLEAKNDGHIVLLSGKDGSEIQRIKTPNGSKTYFMPQPLKQDQNLTYIIFGTGTPSTPGNLSVVPLNDLLTGNLSNNTQTLYQDKYSGVFVQSALVDITGDKILDIITSMYNSMVVAIDGRTFKQIWNFTIPDSVTNISPTPGYFNFDNITDFLIIYQKYDNIMNYNYTETFIIDGKTGKPIYKPANNGIISQLNGLTLSMESYGYDFFVFWTTDCSGTVEGLNSECTHLTNSSGSIKLEAWNDFHQPPGAVIFNSANRENEEQRNTTTMSILQLVKKYIKNQIKFSVSQTGQSEVNENYKVDPVPISVRKYGSGNSVFRHKDKPNPIIKGFMDVNNENSNPSYEPDSQSGEQAEYEWSQNQLTPEELDSDIMNSFAMEDTKPYNPNQLLLKEPVQKTSNRDPRSKDKTLNDVSTADIKSKKKNLSEKIYSYKNVRLAKNRLLHDVNNFPTDIIRETYFKNEANRLKKSKFEQRDINSHNNKDNDDADVKKLIEEEKHSVINGSLTLWDLETEKELQEHQDGVYGKRKRSASVTQNMFRKVSSVGAILDSLNAQNSTNSIDFVFITQSHPTELPLKSMLSNDLNQCVEEKLKLSLEDAANSPLKSTESERRVLFQSECEREQDNLTKQFTYFNQLSRLRLGQIIVYRIRIECVCESVNNSTEKCARFLPKSQQSWPSYLGRLGDGVFKTKL